jgi:hypothetical protein
VLGQEAAFASTRSSFSGIFFPESVPLDDSLEIQETQGQSFAENPRVSVEIPVSPVDLSDYVSLKGTQESLDPSIWNLPLTQTSHPPSQLASSELLVLDTGATQVSLPQSAAIDKSESTNQVEVPASSGPQRASSHTETEYDTSPEIIRSTGSETTSSSPKTPAIDFEDSALEANNQLADEGLALFSNHQLVGTPSNPSNSLTRRFSPAQSPVKPQSESLFRHLFSQSLTLPSLVEDLRSSSDYTSTPLHVPPLDPNTSNMDNAAVRRSPRLPSASLAAGTRSPRPAPLRRALSPQQGDDEPRPRTAHSQPPSFGPHLTPDARPSPSRQNNSFIAERAYNENSFAMSANRQPTEYDSTTIMPSLPIQPSIEDDPTSSTEEHNSIASKASSSQVSLSNEYQIPQVDGISLPLTPVIGPSEYAVPLPAEGKIQSSYTDLIKAKRNTLLKFVHRRDSVGSANGRPSRTTERNQMIELMDLLHDTVTHFDLSLPGSVTQYSIDTEQAAIYAQYAGSKFVFLEHLLDILKSVDFSLIIACKPGRVQNLLVEYLKMKHIRLHHFDQPGSARAVTPEIRQATLKVDVISTTLNYEINVSPQPRLMLAFDSTFDAQNSHIARIRELHSSGRNRLLPVLHLLVQNSSEHVDRCLRKAMPSPQRLKLLVRATYQARNNLGGPPTYVPMSTDDPEGRAMDMHDLQKAVRKSPNRKLGMIGAVVARAALAEDFQSAWNLEMPELVYEDLEESPTKSSRVTTAAGTATATPRDGRARSRTPLSRAGTPSGRKRLLDVEGASSMLSKRVRLSPMRELTPTAETARGGVEIEQLREQLREVTARLAEEKALRLKTQDDLDSARVQIQTLHEDHRMLANHWESSRKRAHKLKNNIKNFEAAAAFNKTKHEKTVENNVKLKAEIAELKTDLAAARDDLKKAGGDIAALEEAREAAREAQASNVKLTKRVESTKNESEYARQLYQDASEKAAALGLQNSELEEQVAALTIKASDEKLKLRELNARERTQQDAARIAQLEQEARAIQVVLKKEQEKVKLLEKGRGVQTRGSSVQPPGSPGINQTPGYGTRSRQGSPAPGGVMSSARDAREAMHSGGPSGRDRVSGLRNER